MNQYIPVATVPGLSEQDQQKLFDSIAHLPEGTTLYIGPYAQPAEGGEAVGEAGTMPGASGFTMACFHADKVPVGTKLYTTPPASQEQADTMKFSGVDDTLQMGRVRRLLEAQGIHMGRAFIAKLVDAAQPAPSVPDDVRIDLSQLGPMGLDAERYRLLRRGQHWSVISGIGDELRAEALDASIDAVIEAAKPGGE